MYDAFKVLENIISNNIKKRYNKDYDYKLNINEYDEVPLDNIVNILDITNNLKPLIKQNINLNLLIDRYIIEVSKELKYVKNSRNNV